MLQFGAGQAPQRLGERRHILRQQIQSKRLDRDETIALRFVRPEDRSERAAANLMQDAKWTKRGWRGRAGRFFERQLLELRETESTRTLAQRSRFAFRVDFV
jgi:hypothetical protein